MKPNSLCPLFACAVLLLTLPALAAEKPADPPVPKTRKNDLAPLPAGEKPVSTHAPFEAGECNLCHQNADPKNPGPVTVPGNEQCLGCHEDFAKIMARKSSHVAAKESCVSCHNPHNARKTKLLVEAPSTLCLSCHEAIKNLALQAPVKHDALTQGAECANCHNPHGANVEHLLVQLPMQLCLGCHSNDDLVDHDGKKLTNFKELLAGNPVQHGPVAMQDCSACHNPHGYRNFRLLNQEYPATFYSTYDPQLYALCFECHEIKAFTEPVTDKLTQFRDGTRNLHYLHVNKTERGRTCRACHEVHASKQEHQIRDAVPYGSKNWMLKVNFTKTPTGGACAKTCHGEKTYVNRPEAARKE